MAALLIGIALLVLRATVAFRSALDFLPLVMGTGLAFFICPEHDQAGSSSPRSARIRLV